MSDETPAPFRVVAGSPTDEETAAVAALLSRLIQERASSPLPLDSAPGRDAWDRTSRTLRAPWPADRDWRDR